MYATTDDYMMCDQNNSILAIYTVLVCSIRFNFQLHSYAYSNFSPRSDLIIWMWSRCICCTLLLCRFSCEVTGYKDYRFYWHELHLCTNNKYWETIPSLHRLGIAWEISICHICWHLPLSYTNNHSVGTLLHSYKDSFYYIRCDKTLEYRVNMR